MESFQQTGPKAEQCAGVKIPAGAHRIRAGQPIRADYLMRFRVPDPQVAIMRVEAIEIQRSPSALARLPERNLAQTADFAQRVGNPRRAAAVRGVVAAFEQ